MSAQDIVDRLDFCRATGAGRWMARCPSHDDSSPSLSIKDVGDGRTLIHCHAGCGALEVLNALGLEWDALYPPTDKHHYRSIAPKRPTETDDSLVIEIAESDRAAGKRLSKADVERYRDAKKRMKGRPMPAPATLAEIKREAWTQEQQAAMEATVLERLENDEPLTARETTWARWQLNHRGGTA